jgi:hypothetical protein
VGHDASIESERFHQFRLERLERELSAREDNVLVLKWSVIARDAVELGVLIIQG